MARGLLVVISSPSGGGKTSIIRYLLQEGDPRYRYSISATTRARRPGEEDGLDYWFLSTAEFTERQERGELIEAELVHGNWYGTPLQPIQAWLREGCIVFFDIDVKGAFTIQRRFPDETCMIFISPPDLQTLEQRLTGRATEKADVVKTRLERVPMEMEMGARFTHNLINRDLAATAAQVKMLISARLQQPD